MERRPTTPRHRHPVAVLALLGLLVSTVLSGAANAQGPPAVAVGISLSSDSVTPGTEITVTMSFSNLEADYNPSTSDYIFRADVKDSGGGDADACEDQARGHGLGVDRFMRRVDEDPETRAGTVSADCPAGTYTIKAVIASAANVELASASAGFTIAEPPADGPCSGGGYNPTPTAVEVEAVPIVVESTTAEYFVLYVRHDLDADTTVEIPVSVTRGAAGTTTLAENLMTIR